MKECSLCFVKAAAWLLCYDLFLQSTVITESDGESGKASGRWTKLQPNNTSTLRAHTHFRLVFNPFGRKCGPIISIITTCSLPKNRETQHHLNWLLWRSHSLSLHKSCSEKPRCKGQQDDNRILGNFTARLHLGSSVFTRSLTLKLEMTNENDISARAAGDETAWSPQRWCGSKLRLKCGL